MSTATRSPTTSASSIPQIFGFSRELSIVPDRKPKCRSFAELTRTHAAIDKRTMPHARQLLSVPLRDLSSRLVDRRVDTFKLLLRPSSSFSDLQTRGPSNHRLIQMRRTALAHAQR
jgi:hypothetical protein